jgi:hypothetical protein
MPYALRPVPYASHLHRPLIDLLAATDYYSTENGVAHQMMLIISVQKHSRSKGTK